MAKITCSINAKECPIKHLGLPSCDSEKALSLPCEDLHDGDLEAIRCEIEDTRDKIKNAMEVIKQAMVDDDPSEPGSYAHSWHCNIAMTCHDAIRAGNADCLTWGDGNSIGNDAASRFMKLCFGVETKA